MPNAFGTGITKIAILPSTYPHIRVCSDGHGAAESGERAITSVQAPELQQWTVGDTGQQWSHSVTRRHLSHTQAILVVTRRHHTHNQSSVEQTRYDVTCETAGGSV